MKARIARYFATVTSAPVADEDDIFALGLVNSLAAMQLVMFVEREFAIVAARQDLDIRHFSSIAALTAFVESKLAVAVAAEPQRGHSTV